MTSRAKAAAALAEAMGWEFSHEDYDFSGPHPTIANAHTFLFDLPRAAAPLHEHLAFVGRIAEALGRGDDGSFLSIERYGPSPTFWEVQFDLHRERGSDLSWAAMLAAVAALSARPSGGE